MSDDERIRKTRELAFAIQQMAARLAREQQELHDMIWKLRGNVVMI